MTFDDIYRAITKTGLKLRAASHELPHHDARTASASGTILLLGFAGRDGWDQFSNSAEARDKHPNPMDRWSSRVIGTLADELGGVALFPFSGPPYLPFQQIALSTGQMFRSPLGVLIDPHYGLWHAFRGALAFAHKLDLSKLDLSKSEPNTSPCETCADKPCLSACPVGAFTQSGYNVPLCSDHLHAKSQTCTVQGCLARNACPVGAEHKYSPDQMRFYMAAFKAAHPKP